MPASNVININRSKAGTRRWVFTYKRIGNVEEINGVKASLKRLQSRSATIRDAAIDRCIERNSRPQGHTGGQR